MLYFSPSNNAFYDDALVGPLEIEGVDDVAYGAAKAAAIAADEEVYQTALDDAGEQKVDRKAFRHNELALMLDPPTKRVPNPDTRLPKDAVPVSAKRHAELMEAQAGGLRIVAGKGGRPEAIEPEVTVEGQLAAIRRRRDAALRQTDWTQMPDALTAAKRELWAEHRQALRDLPGIVEKALKTKKRVPDFPTPPS